MRSIFLVFIGVAVVLISIWPGFAAVELLDGFQIDAFSDQLHLSWSTNAEYNVSSFQVMCKDNDAPESAYHVIFETIARGDVDRGASYDFTIQDGLEPGKSYCFRLQEVTTDDEPGDYFEHCGYGFSITPTPGLAPTLTPVILFTPTITSSITSTVGITGTVTITPTVVLTPTVDPAANVAPTQVSPLVAPTAAGVPQSPLPTPTFTAIAADVPAATLTFTPTPTFTSTPLPAFTPTSTLTQSQTITQTATVTITLAPNPTAVDGNVDTDGDGVLNSLEVPANESVGFETYDGDNDGIPNYLDEDDDGDGIDTAQEAQFSGLAVIDTDTDGDGLPNFLDDDDDNDGVKTANEDPDLNLPIINNDSDGDGTPDYLDTDDDGDGVLTIDEDVDQNGDPVTDDSDGDGVFDYLDTDDDNDGLPTLSEDMNTANGPIDDDTDGDGLPNYRDADDDNDGVPTADEDLNANDNPDDDDADGDGIPSYLDADEINDRAVGGDSDKDGVKDRAECPARPCLDTDLDGSPNYADNDDDGDGVITYDVANPAALSENVNGDEDPANDDSDGDLIWDYLDEDDNNNGILTIDEDTDGNGDLFNDDADGDGIPDFRDTNNEQVAAQEVTATSTLEPTPSSDGSGERLAEGAAVNVDEQGLAAESDSTAESGATPDASQGGASAASADYVVLTYTPTPYLGLVNPVFTPLPINPTPSSFLGLGRYLSLNTENLMATMLCFTFFSASGLGILGLVTSALYMRSRRRRREYP